MHPSHAPLASLATTLDEMVARVATTGEALLSEDREVEAADLFEVERSLRAASSRLAVALRRLS